MLSGNVNLMEENVIQINDRITINVDATTESIKYVKKIIFRITTTRENGKHLPSIIDDSVILCDRIIYEERKTVTRNFNEKNEICKTNNFYI